MLDLLQNIISNPDVLGLGIALNTVFTHLVRLTGTKKDDEALGYVRQLFNFVTGLGGIIKR